MEPVLECPVCGYHGEIEDFNEVEEDDYWEFDEEFYDRDDWNDWVRDDPSLERQGD